MECNCKNSEKIVFPTGSFVTSDGIRISFKYCRECQCYKKLKDEKVIFLLHGAGYDSNYFVCLMKLLCSKATVYAWDMRGHGKSDRPDDFNNYSMTRLTQDLVEFMDFVKVPVAYSLIGHSLGSVIAINFSSLYPERISKGLITEGFNPCFAPLPEWAFPASGELVVMFGKIFAAYDSGDCKLLEELLTELNNYVDPEKCPPKENLVNVYCNNIPVYKLILSPILATYDVRDKLELIKIPTMITVGNRDPFVPLGASIFSREKIENSTLVEYMGQGHNPAVLYKEAFENNVYNFLFVDCSPCCNYLENNPPCKALCRKCKKKKET